MCAAIPATSCSILHCRADAFTWIEMLAKRLLCCNLFANILFDYGHKKKEAQLLEFPFCDPGEARTLDPMIKSHLLYQLSYGVSFLFVSGAKVIRIFESASISAEKIDFVCYFFAFFAIGGILPGLCFIEVLHSHTSVLPMSMESAVALTLCGATGCPL